jgi:AcrR family transcriptional regulator
MRGRQAEAARNDQHLLDAARQVFATRGFDAPVSAVAAAAGIGMGSLYRRYATKDDLLADLCLRSMRTMASIATAQRPGADPWERLATFVRECVEARCGAFAPIAGTIPVSAEMIAAARLSQRLAAGLVTDAQAAGLLRRDVTVVDVLRLIEMFSAARSASPDRLLAIALAGLRAERLDQAVADAPLPGHPESLAAYRARWTAERDAPSRLPIGPIG